MTTLPKTILQSTHVGLMRENNKDVPTCKDCHAGFIISLYSLMGEKSPRDVPKGYGSSSQKVNK